MVVGMVDSGCKHFEVGFVTVVAVVAAVAQQVRDHDSREHFLYHESSDIEGLELVAVSVAAVVALVVSAEAGGLESVVDSVVVADVAFVVGIVVVVGRVAAAGVAGIVIATLKNFFSLQMLLNLVGKIKNGVVTNGLVLMPKQWEWIQNVQTLRNFQMLEIVEVLEKKEEEKQEERKEVLSCLSAGYCYVFASKEKQLQSVRCLNDLQKDLPLDDLLECEYEE